MPRSLADYFELALAKMPRRSRRLLAQHFGLSQSAVDLWFHGRTLPTDENMMRFADLCGISREAALVDLAIWRTTESALPFWQRIADRIERERNDRATLERAEL